MPRKVLALTSQFPYHISARCLNKEWFDIPLREVWKIFEEYLHFIHFSFNIDIHAFVLMSNHFHLLVRAPEGNLSQAMNYFMRETSRQIGYSAGRINQTYGGRFLRSQIQSHHYYLNAYKYIYRNPIEAGVCEKAEEYKFSSLGLLVGKSKSIIPIVEDITLFSDVEGTLNWINTGQEKEVYEVLRKAMRKKVMEFAIDRLRQRPHFLTTVLY